MTNFGGISDNSFLIKNALEHNKNESLGVDFREINNLSKDEKIKQIAVQFEQMFIKTLLKNVFKDEKKESGFGMGAGTLNDIRHNLFSQHITENGGLGYQEIIEKQIREKYFKNEGDDKNKTAEKNEIDAEFIREYRSVNGSIFSNDSNKFRSLNNMLSDMKKRFYIKNR